jgi:hypothetical protein
MTSNVQQNLIETRVQEFGGSLQNKQTLRRILKYLFEHAEKGNWASNKLEDEWGFTQDYSGGQDWGNEITN